MSGALDPVCGREVDPLRARAVGIFGGVTYYFCSSDCKARFRDPRSAPVVVPDAVPAPEKRVERRPPARVEPAPSIVQQTLSGVESTEPDVVRKKVTLGPLHIVAVLVAIGVPATLVLTHLPQPGVVAPTTPVAPPPSLPVVAPVPAAPKEEPPTVVPDLQPPLKLGLRRFVEEGTVSLRLLVIDSSNRAVPVTIARQPGAPATLEEAVEPAAEFVAASAKAGTIFDAHLEKLDVKIERVADAVVAEMRSGEAPWHVVVRIPLAVDAQVRAAPFARKRYLSQETTP